jgi:murein DD-endopeptidase MepM/ murein hydrolase activator NlpD
VLALLLAFALARAPLAAPPPPPPTWSIWPADGTITAPFGNDGGRHHPGIDIGMLRSLTVRAAQPGRVIAVGTPTGLEGYGNVVEVQLGEGYVALYAHLADWQVHVGEEVAAGQRLGTAGCTGWCSGTHLHFELRHLDTPVSPLSYRRAQRSGVRRAASFCFRSGDISSTVACRTNVLSSSSKR